MEDIQNSNALTSIGEDAPAAIVKKNSFAALGLTAPVLAALAKKGFEEPTPIQAMVIPVLLAGGHDVVGQAQTGTGKTAAFALPLLEKLIPHAGHVQALVLAPTRELAVQVSEEIASFKGEKTFSVAPIYGGQSMSEQLRRLKRGVDIVVGTPGRVMDHMDRGSLQLSRVQYVILDEADEMLDMGFQEDIEKILQSVNPERKMLLFSATMPDRILTIAKTYMKNYQLLAVKSEQLTTDMTDQIYFEVAERDKFEALCRIIDMEDNFYGMIFCRTKIQVDDLYSKLMDRGYGAEALHGDISQSQREVVLKKFKAKKINVLAATDVAARGIDVSDLTHVINYSLPQDPESYVHRIGRTGRAGKQGTAVTFITPDEYRKLTFIKRVSKTEIRKERIPGVQEIIAIKKARITAQLEETVQEGDFGHYAEMATELLSGKEPPVILAAVLKRAFGDELDESNYAPVQDFFSRSEKKPIRDGEFGRGRAFERNEDREARDFNFSGSGKARLFVALGRVDGMSPRKIVELIKGKTTLPDRLIDDVAVFDIFSFVTVPFHDAEHIIKVFQKMGRGGKPLVTLAKDGEAQEPAPFKPLRKKAKY